MLVERDHLLDTLNALVAQAAAGHGGLVLLGGEAGVGKTSLSAALADAARNTLTVRRGGCDNMTTADALGPLIDAVPELGTVIEDEAEVNRLRLFRRLRAVLGEAPTLLLLEDVHWADEATLEILRYLGRRIEGMPLLVLATFRSDEVVGSHPLTVVLGDLATAPGVRRVQLGPLSVAGVSRLVEAAGSLLDPEEVHRSTGGNAFYVTEVLATGEQSLPATVRDAVLARASRLSPRARQVLAAARQALELVDSLGATAVRQAILRDRHAACLPVPRGPRTASLANPSGLTGREIDVLRLLVDGLSNADMADHLYLSEKTVGHHVSSVLRKLGEPTRSRAVAAAIRQGIVTP